MTEEEQGEQGKEQEQEGKEQNREGQERRSRARGRGTGQREPLPEPAITSQQEVHIPVGLETAAGTSNPQ